MTLIASSKQPDLEHFFLIINPDVTGLDAQFWRYGSRLLLRGGTLRIGQNHSEVGQENRQGKEKPHPESGGHHTQNDADRSDSHRN